MCCWALYTTGRLSRLTCLKHLGFWDFPMSRRGCLWDPVALEQANRDTLSFTFLWPGAAVSLAPTRVLFGIILQYRAVSSALYSWSGCIPCSTIHSARACLNGSISQPTLERTSPWMESWQIPCLCFQQLSHPSPAEKEESPEWSCWWYQRAFSFGIGPEREVLLFLS